MSAANITAIVVGLIGAISGVSAAWLSSRASRRTAENEKAAAVLAQWSEIVDALQDERQQLRQELADERAAHQDEIKRHVDELARAAQSIAECERRCRECHADRGELLANLRALGELVADEVTKSAVATVLADNADVVDDRIELDAIKAFLREARRQQRDAGGEP